MIRSMQEIAYICRAAYSQSVQLLLIPSERKILFMLLSEPVEMATIVMCFDISYHYNIQF